MLNLWSQQRSSSQPLSPTLSQAFLRHAQAKLGQYGLNSPHHYHHEAEIRQRFKQLGEWLAIDDLAYTESGWPDSTWPHWDQWQETRHKFLETLRFRHQLEASFLETPQ